MNYKDFLNLPKDNLAELLNMGRVALQMTRLVISSVSGEEVESSEFQEVRLNYDHEDKRYSLIGVQDDGFIDLSFQDPKEPYFLKWEEGKDEPNKIPVLVKHSQLIDGLTICKRIVDSKAAGVEEALVREYTSQIVYGTNEYLENEFKSFARQRILEISKCKNIKDAVNKLPFKFNFKNRIYDYLKENKGNMSNVHVINN